MTNGSITIGCVDNWVRDNFVYEQLGVGNWVCCQHTVRQLGSCVDDGDAFLLHNSSLVMREFINK